MEYSEADYSKRFNLGYSLSEYAPEIANLLVKSKYSQLLKDDGFLDGMEQYSEEKQAKSKNLFNEVNHRGNESRDMPDKKNEQEDRDK